MRRKLRKKAIEPAREIEADLFLMKVFPESQIIRFYPRWIEGNTIKTSKSSVFGLRAYDFRHCPEALEQLKHWINSWELK